MAATGRKRRGRCLSWPHRVRPSLRVVPSVPKAADVDREWRGDRRPHHAVQHAHDEVGRHRRAFRSGISGKRATNPVDLSRAVEFQTPTEAHPHPANRVTDVAGDVHARNPPLLPGNGPDPLAASGATLSARGPTALSLSLN